MKSANRPPITEQMLQRLCLWLALVVARLAGPWLNAFAPRARARLLDDYARDAATLLVARAVKRIGFKAPRIPRPWGTNAPCRRRYNVRRVAGARLRRALRAVSRANRANDRIWALCACLADGERWIAHITRRLRRGLTKLRPLPKPRRMRLIANACVFAAPDYAVDTS